jgi:hypothetical protein
VLAQNGEILLCVTIMVPPPFLKCHESSSPSRSKPYQFYSELGGVA